MTIALITGITGQDGPYLAQFLLDKGYKVYGEVRDSAVTNTANLQFLGILDSVHLIPANLLDLSTVIKFLDTIKADEIYNLAAQSSVALSFQQPISTIEFNIMSTLNLLEASKILGLGARFYQASSSEMYGNPKTLPVTEETVLHPVSPYGISKAAAHWLTINYREAFDLPCCCGILFNHESVLRARHFVTKKIITAVVRISKGLQEKLKLGNIEVKRDWGYAPEYVKAMWLMLQQDRLGEYVIATNEPHSLKEFVAIAFASLGLDWKEHVIIDEGLYRHSDIDIIYGSPKKAREELGWEYHLSFEELVELLVQEELEYEKILLGKSPRP